MTLSVEGSWRGTIYKVKGVGVGVWVGVCVCVKAKNHHQQQPQQSLWISFLQTAVVDINTLVINILSCEGAEGLLGSYEQSWLFVKSVEVQIILCIPIHA